jgi:hypothetical protein
LGFSTLSGIKISALLSMVSITGSWFAHSFVLLEKRNTTALKIGVYSRIFLKVTRSSIVEFWSTTNKSSVLNLGSAATMSCRLTFFPVRNLFKVIAEVPI